LLLGFQISKTKRVEIQRGRSFERPLLLIYLSFNLLVETSLTLPVGFFQAIFPLRQTSGEAWAMLRQHFISHPVGVLTDLRE
jgi:hypothetical protein